LQRGETEDDEKPTFAPLPPNTKIETVTLEQALEMLKLPRTVGKTADGDEIKANIGRFGPYVQVGKHFISIKPLDPHTITETEALNLYQAKLKKDAKRVILAFPSGIRILLGPYGPYVNDGKKNARISKDIDPKKLTEEESRKLLDAAPAKKRSFRRKRTAK
jgi:DNA topoisomerase-1